MVLEKTIRIGSQKVGNCNMGSFMEKGFVIIFSYKDEDTIFKG